MSSSLYHNLTVIKDDLLGNQMPTVYYHTGQFPPSKIDWEALSRAAGHACIELGRYDGLLSAVPNASLLLAPLRTQEAVLSSSIEGTRVTMNEVMEIEAGALPDSVTPSKRDDAEEVFNYRKALDLCAYEISKRPISQQMLRQAHQILMKGVRGKDKTPGCYRIDQNWIGEPGCTLDNAAFVPIAPEHLQAGMDAWGDFVQQELSINPLIKLALVHVEFEALHPFRDGNGRLGRMLIPLLLYQEKILNSPSFYMSAFLEQHRDEYQYKMRAVSKGGAWTEWIEFFVQGVATQAAANVKKAKNILSLYERMKEKVVQITHSQHAIRTIDFLFSLPIFSSSTFSEFSGVPGPTAKTIISRLTTNDILRLAHEGSGRKPNIYVFEALMEIIGEKGNK